MGEMGMDGKRLEGHFHDLMVEVVPKLVRSLDFYTDHPETKLEDGQTEIENDDYSCTTKFFVIREDEDHEGEFVASDEPGIKGYVPMLFIRVGDFCFERNMTPELEKYLYELSLDEELRQALPERIPRLFFECQYDVDKEFSDKYHKSPIYHVNMNKRITREKEAYRIDLKAYLDAVNTDDYTTIDEALFAWVRNNSTNLDVSRKYTFSCFDFLKKQLPETILLFYHHLKGRLNDTETVGKAMCHLFENTLRPVLEGGHVSDPDTYKTDYYSLLKGFVTDQLLAGDEGWRCLQLYSYYDDYADPRRRQSGFDPSDAKEIKDAFCRSLDLISDVSPVKAMEFYSRTLLSRIVPITDFNEIMRGRLGDAWDINAACHECGGIVFEAKIDADDVNRHRRNTPDNIPEREAFYVEGKFDFFVKFDGKFYCFNDFDPYDLESCRSYSWEELGIGNMSIDVEEEICICDSNMMFEGCQVPVRFRLKNDYSKNNVGGSDMLSYNRYIFRADSIDISPDGVVMSGSIGCNIASHRQQFVRDLEISCEAQGDDQFYCDEHIKRSLKQFVRSYKRSVLDDDADMKNECKRLAAVIGNAYRYNSSLALLLEGEKGFETDEEMSQFFGDCLYDHYDRYFIVRDNDKTERNKVALRMGLYELYLDLERRVPQGNWDLLREIDNTLFNHRKDRLFFLESEWRRRGAISETLEVEKFWYLSYRFLSHLVEPVFDSDAYCLYTLYAYWDNLKFKMAHGLSDKSKDSIAKILHWGVFFEDHETPIVPVIAMTLKRDQLTDILKLADKDSSKGSFSDELEKVLRSEKGIRWRELYFRLKMLNYTSVEEIIDTFILLVHELDIKDHQISSLILTLYQDIVELEKQSGKSGFLRQFMEGVVSGLCHVSDLSVEAGSDRLKEIESARASAYTIRRKELVKYLLSTYEADGLFMLNTFSKVDPLAGRRFTLDQGQRIGTFRTIQVNSERELLELFGGAHDMPIWANAVTDDKEDEILNFNPLFKKAVIDAHDKGYTTSDIFDIFFDTCLTSYIRLDIFIRMIKEIYGDEWDINSEIERVKPFYIMGRIIKDDSIDYRVYDPWALEPPIITMDMMYSSSERPDRVFEDDTYEGSSAMYIHDPSIRVVCDIIKLTDESAIDSELYLKISEKYVPIRIDHLSINDNGAVIATGTVDQ